MFNLAENAFKCQLHQEYHDFLKIKKKGYSSVSIFDKFRFILLTRVVNG
jgi:hypothetical protein